MKFIATFPLVLAVSTGTFGCASSKKNAPFNKHVVVSVIDSKSHEPVQGATVSVRYVHSNRGDKALTDQAGRAVLKVNCGLLSDIFSYDVEVVNRRYDQHLGLGTDLDELATRSPDFIPTKPDVVLEIASRVEEKRAEAERAAKQKSDQQAAEQLLRDRPEYWPDRKDDLYAFPRTDVDQMLLWKRWEHASKKQLGSAEDIDAVRLAVIGHMKHPQASVNEIRWISANLVMVKSSWYSSPLASAGYTYALRKTNAGWTVVAYYMNYIS